MSCETIVFYVLVFQQEQSGETMKKNDDHVFFLNDKQVNYPNYTKVRKTIAQNIDRMVSNEILMLFGMFWIQASFWQLNTHQIKLTQEHHYCYEHNRRVKFFSSSEASI